MGLFPCSLVTCTSTSIFVDTLSSHSPTFPAIGFTDVSRPCRHFTSHNTIKEITEPTFRPPDTTGVRATLSGSEENVPATCEITVPDLCRDVTKLNPQPVFNGTYSRVYLGSYRSGKVAIKVLRTIKSNHATERKFQRELSIWWRLHHPSVISLYGYLKRDDGVEISHALVSEWAEGGSAAQYIRGDLTWSQRMSLLHDVANGLQYLHTFEYPVVHGDIKPLNVLIGKNGVAQLCDFGLARFIEYEPDSGMATTTPHIGTIRYLACELVKCSRKAVPSTATDVYALGCLALEFMHQISPHSDLVHPFEVSGAIGKGTPPIERPPNSEPSVPEYGIY